MKTLFRTSFHAASQECVPGYGQRVPMGRGCGQVRSAGPLRKRAAIAPVRSCVLRARSRAQVVMMICVSVSILAASSLPASQLGLC